MKIEELEKKLENQSVFEFCKNLLDVVEDNGNECKKIFRGNLDSVKINCEVHERKHETFSKYKERTKDETKGMYYTRFLSMVNRYVEKFELHNFI